MFERIREVLRRSREAGQAYPPQLAFLLRNPLRGLIQFPSALIHRLSPQPGDPDFIARDVITPMAEAAGFRAARHWGKGRNYSAEFRRP